MRLAKSFLVPALALSAGYAVIACAPAEVARAADAPADPWAAIKELEKAGDEGKCVAKMQEYRDSGGAAAIANISGLKTSKKDKIACAAIKMVAASGDPELHKWLSGKLEDKDLADVKDGRPEVYKAVLDALVPYGENNKKDGVQGKLEKVIMKYQGTNADYATRAVRAYGTVPDKFTVDYLLKLAETLDSRSGKGGGGGGNSKGASTETRDNEAKVRTAVMETLNLLTSQDIADAETFRKWWTEKSKTFVFPKPRDPNAPEPAKEVMADPSALNEFVDEGYGYSVKKPEVTGWKFEKADYDGPRVALTYSSPDDPAYREARAYFSIHNPKKSAPKDIKGFVEWAKEKIFTIQLDMHDKPVDVREATIGGVTWTVVTGKGDGIDVKKGWGTMERRFYFAMAGTNILYIDAFVRLGSEKEIQDTLWKAVEATAITAKK